MRPSDAASPATSSPRLDGDAAQATAFWHEWMREEVRFLVVSSRGVEPMSSSTAGQG